MVAAVGPVQVGLHLARAGVGIVGSWVLVRDALERVGGRLAEDGLAARRVVVHCSS